MCLGLATPASAGTIRVTTTFDQLDGVAPCSLREAVSTANSDVDSGGCTDLNPAAADTIRLAGGDYHLSRFIGSPEDANVSGDLDVKDAVTIAGAGADLTGIDGNGSQTADRVVHAHSFAGTVTLMGLTVHDGSTGENGGGISVENDTALKLVDSTVRENAADDGSGGGINATPAAPLTLIRSTVSGNTAMSGGGINADTATLSGSAVTGNGATFFGGGGIHADVLELNASTVSGNTGPNAGGIFSDDFTLVGSTVSGNTATSTATSFGTGGGGIMGAGTLTTSTVTRNRTGARGGGIHSYSGSLTLTRSTVSGNDARGRGAGIFFSSGGGTPGTLTVTNSTLSGNESFDYGGGIATDAATTANLRSATINRNVANGGGVATFGSSTVNLLNTILAGNDDPTTDPEYDDVFCEAGSGVVSQGYNLLSGGTEDCTVAPAVGDQTTSDPRVDQLAVNGGPTPTSALLGGSAAINRGHPGTPGSASACPATDQRGVPRTLGGRCDKGAYERVTCQGRLVNRVGTGAAETLIGTSAADGILGLGGNDVIRGGAAGDGLCGGVGNDQLFGEAGPDALEGGPGTDTCNGGTEADQAVSCETTVSIP